MPGDRCTALGTEIPPSALGAVESLHVLGSSLRIRGTIRPRNLLDQHIGEPRHYCLTQRETTRTTDTNPALPFITVEIVSKVEEDSGHLLIIRPVDRQLYPTTMAFSSEVFWGFICCFIGA